MSATDSAATAQQGHGIDHRTDSSGALARCVTVALAVIVIDIGTKIAATSLLGERVVSTGGGTFLGIVHNDSFARGGADMGSLAAPATLLLAAILLFVIGRVCSPLARVDSAAPRALGFVAGAAAANALDFVRTGRGVVDFLGIHTASGSIVFNLADVAAYIGVVMLARTTWLVARAALQEQRLREAQPRYARLHAAAEAAWAHRHDRRRSPELVRSVPIFVEKPPAGDSADRSPARPSRSPTASTGVQPQLGDADLTVPNGGQVDMSLSDIPTRPKLTLIVNRPPAR